MATKKKANTSSKKKTTTKKKTPAQVTPEETAEFTQEVILWVVLAVSILLFISNLGFGGAIGGAISGFFFGVFGLIAYLFPICLLAGTFFVVSNKTNTFAMIKMIAAVFFVLFLCLFVELIVHGSDTIGAIRAYSYGAEHQSGGGFFGGMLAAWMCHGFGLVGAYVVDIAILIISFVLITEKSAFKEMQRRSGIAKEHAQVRKNDKRIRTQQQKEERFERNQLAREQRKEQRRLQQEEQKRLAAENASKPRRERKVEGIAFDTTIAEDIPTSTNTQGTDEVSEVKINIFDEDTEIADMNRVPLVSTQKAKRTYTKKKADAAQTDTAPTASTNEKPAHAIPHITTMESLPSSDVDNEVVEDIAETVPVTEPTGRTRRSAGSAAEIAGESAAVAATVQQNMESPKKEYKFPPISLLKKMEKKANANTKNYLMETADKLQQTLKNFGVNVTVTDVSCGPAVTRYELQPEMGVKVSKIVNLADDIKLNLAAPDIRIEAPIPGKAAVGIEVPNKENVMVSFRELMESADFKMSKSNIAFAAGRDIAGNVVVSDISKMPHVLIAGATGSGKSVCINTIIMSILYKANPEDVKFIMIDPKVVELSVYNGIPHLLIPVVTDPKKAAGALHWAVTEMTDRYNRFADAGVRDMKGYNSKIVNGKMKLHQNGEMIEVATAKMPQIVIIVDELADLMMVASSDVEEAICRLAQLARAAGIHLVIATQRPSVNVITGLIKANMPSRIAFSVSSGVDSRTILDMIGAEKLLGKGDMLYYPQGFTKPLRVQGAFVSDDEVQKVVSFLTEHNDVASYDSEIENKIQSVESSGTAIGGGEVVGDERDMYFEDAARLIIDKEKGSIGMLQRNFKIGFNRAARIMDQLEDAGVVGPEEGTKPRRVMMSLNEFEELVNL